MSAPVLADEGGLSFWLPGTFGSLSATPATPGWSWATFYVHTDVASGAGAQFPRGGRVDVGISGRGDLVGFGPTYVFATPVLGAQLSVSVLDLSRSFTWNESPTLCLNRYVCCGAASCRIGIWFFSVSIG